MADKSAKISRYTALRQYFDGSESDAPRPIAHPDQEINRIAQDRFEADSLRKAAVLLPITRHEADSESHIVLTVRSANLKSHAGQISLPGGTREEHDADDEATALRESEEEIGLQSRHVEIIGKLGHLALPSGFHVTPVVGVIDSRLSFTPQPEEVADIFQAPLDLILEVGAYRNTTMMFNGKPRQILELHYEDYRIWGATAAILYHLAREVEGV